MSILTDLARDFKSVLEGTSELQSDQLSGGARIAYVFHEWYAAGVRDLDPFDKIKDGDIRTILYNSSGSQPALFVGTQAFEVLVKPVAGADEDAIHIKLCALGRIIPSHRELIPAMLLEVV